MAAARGLQQSLHVPPWSADPALPVEALKRALARHRRQVILPAVQTASTSCPMNPPLPWAWIALNADTLFSQEAFTLWWQIRVLGKSYPGRACPWCGACVRLDRGHLQQQCITFATICWTRSIQPEEVFAFPEDHVHYIAALAAIDELLTASRVHNQLRQSA